MKPSDTVSASEPASATGRITVRQRELLSDVWARLERVTLDYRRQDGQTESQVREIYHRGHGAAVLMYDPQRRYVVLVRQFRLAAWEIEQGMPSRHSNPGFLLEVPAGVVEHDDPAETARNEAWEETGIRIGTPRFLYTGYASPGSVTEQIHYFDAPYSESSRQGAGGGLAAEGEDIEVLEMPIDDAWSQVVSGEIRDAKTILLLQHALLGPLATR
jgi:nudix-type nucleoside diphosphatase (YffH/AdpP family)